MHEQSPTLFPPLISHLFTFLVVFLTIWEIFCDQQLPIGEENRGGAKSNGPPLISTPDGIPDSLIISWIDNTQLIKAALSDLNFYSLLDCNGRISERLSHQKVKTHLHRIKIQSHKERCVVKFLFLPGKRSKVIHAKLSEVHGEAAASLATVKRWYWGFKDGKFSLDDEFRSVRPRDDIGEARSQFVNKEPSLLHEISQRGLY
jgi:hypothetical protein